MRMRSAELPGGAPVAEGHSTLGRSADERMAAHDCGTPTLERDRLCLLPDGLKQTLYNPSDRPEVPVPRLIESSSHVARVLDDYFHFGLDMHLQSRLGRITHDSEGFSAFLEGSRVDLRQPAARLHVVLYAMYLNARRVNNPVLVLVPAIVHKAEVPDAQLGVGSDTAATSQ